MLRITERLRSGTLTDREQAEAGEQLVALARHSKWEVRKAVALAIHHLRHPTFHDALAPLLQDENALVREVARQSASRRGELTRIDVLAVQHRDLLRGSLAKLESTYGRPAAEAALHVAEKLTELLLHELRHEIVRIVSPMDAAIGNLRRTIEREDMDQQACSRHMSVLQRGLGLLMNSIDELTKLFADIKPEFRSEDMREMVEEAAALVKEDAVANRAHHVVVENTVPDGLRVEAHRLHLMRAFRNVLQNAFEAYDGRRDVDARVVVAARVHEVHRRVTVSFVDRGCGMSPEALRDAMRLHATSKPRGMGLGLPLAQRIIETVHGGSIHLASTEGVGTTVKIVLPIAQYEDDELQESI